MLVSSPTGSQTVAAVAHLSKANPLRDFQHRTNTRSEAQMGVKIFTLAILAIDTRVAQIGGPPTLVSAWPRLMSAWSGTCRKVHASVVRLHALRKRTRLMSGWPEHLLHHWHRD
eukprot:637173-Pelagomonas_calceolata.AAC.6